MIDQNDSLGSFDDTLRTKSMYNYRLNFDPKTLLVSKWCTSTLNVRAFLLLFPLA